MKKVSKPKLSELPKEGPEQYHTSLKAMVDYKDFYGSAHREHEVTAVTKNYSLQLTQAAQSK